MSGGYRILIDYGAYEGMRFWNDVDYATVDEAVKEAVSASHGSPFYVVQIIDWQARATS